MTRLAQEAAPWRPEEETDVRHTKSSSRTHEAVVRIERTPSRERDMPSWPALAASPAREPSRFTTQVRRLGQIRVWRMLKKYLTFVGPGVLVSVAYIDPGKDAGGRHAVLTCRQLLDGCRCRGGPRVQAALYCLCGKLARRHSAVALVPPGHRDGPW